MRGLALFAVCVASVAGLDTGARGVGLAAFSPAFRPLPAHRGRLSAASSLCMQGGGFGRQQEAANRDQRRGAKKAEQAKAKAAASPKARSMQDASEVLARGLKPDDARTPSAPAKPAALEKLRTEEARRREEAIKGIRANSKSPKVPTGLPLEEEVRQIPIETLESVEKALFVGVFAAGGFWVLAGLGTAYDAYMIATKQTVPAGLDEALGKYVEPFLTPGLGAILLFSVMLGGIQVYKFEGGRK